MGENMKKKLLLLLLLVACFIPVKASALTGDVSISCDKNSVKVGEKIVCTVDGNSDGSVSYVFANISANGGIRIEKFKAEHIWEIKSEWPNLSLYSTTKKPGNFEIGTVYLKAVSAGQGNFMMTGISFTSDDGSNASPANKAIAVNVIGDSQTSTPTPTPTPSPTPEDTPAPKSSDSKLKSLTVSNGTINFNADTLQYYIEVGSNINSIRFEAVPNDSKASVKLPDNLSLNTGVNNFEIIVTAEDGTTTTYKISVNKLEKLLSDNALLKSLSIKGHNIKFSSDVFEYNLGTIKHNSLDIKAISDDTNSNVKIYGSNNIGKNDTIIVRVTSQSGNIKDYVIYANYNGSTTSTNNSLLLIVSSSLFVLSTIIIILLLLGRSRYKKKIQHTLDEERKSIELLRVELQNKLAMIPPAPEKNPGPVLPTEPKKEENPLEGIDADVLKQREEEPRNKDLNIEAEEVLDLESVVEKKAPEKEEKIEPVDDAKDIAPPEVEKVVKAVENITQENVVESVEEDDSNITEISAESVASVVKEKNETEDINFDKDSKNKKNPKKESKK